VPASATCRSSPTSTTISRSANTSPGSPGSPAWTWRASQSRSTGCASCSISPT